MGKDEELDPELVKKFEKYVKSQGGKRNSSELDMNEVLNNITKQRMMDSFGAQSQGNSGVSMDAIVKAIKETKDTGMDPTMMMMMMMFMGQNQQQPAYPPYPGYGASQEPKEDMLDKMMRYKLMSDVFSGKNTGGLDDFMKMYTMMNGGKDDQMTKFIDYMKEQNTKQKDDQTARSIDSIKEEMRRSLVAINNPQSMNDPLSIIKQYQALRASLDEIYKYATPEQQAQFPKEGEEWGPDDVVTLAQKVIGTIPTIATAVNAVRGERRARPPKKDIPDENLPMPADKNKGELPEDIDEYFKSWRGPPNTSAIDGFGQRFEDPESPGKYYTKSEMMGFAKQNPEEMRNLIHRSQRNQQEIERQQREENKKAEREERAKNPPRTPPPPPPAEPEQNAEYYENEPEPEESFVENEPEEQEMEAPEQPPTDPDSLAEEPEQTEPESEEVEENGEGQ